MVRGGKVGCKRNFNRRVRSKDKGSDDSDEDYVVSDEENEVSDGWEEDCCFSVDGYASEESFGSFFEEEEDEDEDEEEEEEEMKVVRSKVRSKAQKSISGQQKVGEKKMVRKRRRVIYDEEEDADEDYEVDDEEDEEEDEEYMLDEEDESVGRKRRADMKLHKRGSRKKTSVRGQKRKRKSKVTKKSLRKKRRKNIGSRRKVQYDDDEDGGSEFVNNRSIATKKSKKKPGPKKRRYVAPLDSDYVSSGSSDYDFTLSGEDKHTISEEERQQVREARELCGNLRGSLRRSTFPSSIQEVGDFHQQRQPQVGKGKDKLEEPMGKKGKEKVEEVRTEVGKQLCGICLSEEDKRRVRGTLDCCSHYFCFACIIEWAKVESRCPLCKQRFKTISKPAKSTIEIDLREVLIEVPERDQVYQPSEEELRSYLDPYENVICTECHEGGDDALMLLCDICDSPAHTYCVGLGREVPEGNWYCDGCRPVALASPSSRVQDHLPDQRARSNSLSNRPRHSVNVRESLDLNSMSSPCTPFAQGFGNLSSPRFPVGDSLAASPASGAGAPTLSGRRWIHRHIQQLLSLNRMNSMAGRTAGTSAANSSSDFLNSRSNQDRDRDTTTQQTRTQEMETAYHAFFEDRLQDNPSPSFQNRDLHSSAISFLRRQAAQDQTTTTTDSSLNGTLCPEPLGRNITGYEEFHQCSRSSNIGYNGSVPPYTVREGIEFHLVKEQLQSTVKKHLKNLARDFDLGNSTFKDIARSSTHTILAACGLEHRRNEAYFPVPQPSVCSHIELMAGGQTSLMKGCCSSCFDSFVGDVVKRIMDTRMPSSSWLSLGL